MSVPVVVPPNHLYFFGRRSQLDSGESGLQKDVFDSGEYSVSQTPYIGFEIAAVGDGMFLIVWAVVSRRFPVIDNRHAGVLIENHDGRTGSRQGLDLLRGFIYGFERSELYIFLVLMIIDIAVLKRLNDCDSLLVRVCHHIEMTAFPCFYSRVLIK